MQPRNAAERRRRIFTFTGLYVGSLILMLFILSAFGVNFSANDPKQPVATAPAADVDERQMIAHHSFVQADSLLHARLDLLQQSDDNYMLSLADTSSSVKRTGAQALSAMYESALKKSVDSVENLSADYAVDKAAGYETMLSSFRSILKSRQALKNLQSSMPRGKTVLSGSPLDMLQWKTELAAKDNELARLASTIKDMQAKETVKTGKTDETQKGEIDLLQTAFADQQKEYNDLKGRYAAIKADNSSMASQLVEYKKTAVSQTASINAAAENKVNTLQQKIEDLNAEIYFTRVDCNLTRADAQQIISNARQRKDLLSESLSMLNSLAASGDATVQKKAKEKIIRLNHIATALHD